MVYQKARELGNLIMESDYAKVLQDAMLAYEQNTVAKQKFEQYVAYKALYQQNLRQRLYSPQDIAAEQKKIKDMSLALEGEEDIVCLINAEEEFNDYVNKVMGILKSTINMGKSCGNFCNGGHCR
ncbi:MAG: YlbF family regulator [Defluviitaleaceae bacterium]|nr:YlbF family regulator [Defluviitaleaceae bacterium]